MIRWLLAILTALLCSVGQAAPPLLGADCGAGATVIGDKTGDKYAAGKVTMGVGSTGTCTLTFVGGWSKVPSCSAMSEESDAAFEGPVGTLTTASTLLLDGRGSKVVSIWDGDIVSYLCVGQ